MENIEIREPNKLIRRNVRQDIKKYNEEIAKEILERCWSTKKVS